MGFATHVASMVSDAITYSTQLVGDFAGYFAFITGIWALGYIVAIMKR